jgi:hypothetical protein
MLLRFHEVFRIFTHQALLFYVLFVYSVVGSSQKLREHLFYLFVFSIFITESKEGKKYGSCKNLRTRIWQ